MDVIPALKMLGEPFAGREHTRFVGAASEMNHLAYLQKRHKAIADGIV
jgi:hypothetical protein